MYSVLTPRIPMYSVITHSGSSVRTHCYDTPLSSSHKYSSAHYYQGPEALGAIITGGALMGEPDEAERIKMVAVLTLLVGVL